MALMNWTRVCALLFAGVSAAPAMALPKLQIHPVELVGYVGQAVKLSVELPCGGEFYGLVASADKRGHLRVAAAVAQDSIVCTSLPDPVEVVVDYLAVTKFKTIEPMNVDGGNSRLLVARINDLRMVATSGGAPTLSAVYEPRCGHDAGTLIRKVGKARLELAFVETPSGMPSMDGCEIGQKTRAITTLDTAAPFKVTALKDKPKSLSRAFRLKLAPVAAGGIHLLPNQGGLSVSYERRCNEAPVGIVLGKPRANSRGMTQKVGVLVAEYYNFPCAAARKDNDPGMTELVERDLTLPKGFSVEAMPTGLADLSLAPPTKIRKASRQPWVIEGRVSCAKEASAVFTRDGNGILTVGVLTHDDGNALGSSQCKNDSGEVSLAQPFVANRVKAGQLRPLRLKGAPSR